jgi:hypothetical protein
MSYTYIDRIARLIEPEFNRAIDLNLRPRPFGRQPPGGSIERRSPDAVNVNVNGG